LSSLTQRQRHCSGVVLLTTLCPTVLRKTSKPSIKAWKAVQRISAQITESNLESISTHPADWCDCPGHGMARWESVCGSCSHGGSSASVQGGLRPHSSPVLSLEAKTSNATAWSTVISQGAPLRADASEQCSRHFTTSGLRVARGLWGYGIVPLSRPRCHK
jgi:hypothetical protein